MDQQQYDEKRQALDQRKKDIQERQARGEAVTDEERARLESDERDLQAERGPGEGEGQTRERKMAEVSAPSPLKVHLENEVSQKLDEHVQDREKNAKALKDPKRQEEIDKLQAQQREADENERVKVQVQALKRKIEDGSITDSELMELKMNPHHVNIGSGHGNPA